MTSAVLCGDARRQKAARAQQLNGIDYLEVWDSSQRLLRLYLFRPAPSTISEKNVVITRGRRIVNVKAVGLRLPNSDEPDDFIEVTTDSAGDFSTYTLKLVETDADGHPTETPLKEFDPRYAQVDFSFKTDCPTDLDCLPDTTCPPEKAEEPEIDYLAKDYSSFRRLLLDRLALIAPDWTERHIPDLGVTLVELLAYAGDYLSYYQDAVATEAYLETARERISIRRHARLVDYPMHEGCNARAWIHLKTDRDTQVSPDELYFFTGSQLPFEAQAGDVPDSVVQQLPAEAYEPFELMLPSGQTQAALFSALAEIHFYTWGDAECCLPRGATSASLIGALPAPSAVQAATVATTRKAASRPAAASAAVDATPSAPSYDTKSEPEEQTPTAPILPLKPGDWLLFEEVLGAITGDPADADYTHRQVVRLTSVSETVDPLNGQSVVEIAWSEEDALSFPLCISALGQAPECVLINNISVARGNLFVVEHGRLIKNEDLGAVAAAVLSAQGCDGEGLPSDTVPTSSTFRPKLKSGPLSYHAPLNSALPAARALAQTPLEAKPRIVLTAEPALPTPWTPQQTLLESDDEETHFVVETDNDGIGHLRFGDDELGRAPDAGTKFSASYYVGNGPSGNIGREMLTHIARRAPSSDGAVIAVRNPFPASGGLAPESVSDVKRFAPTAFRKRLERAITEEDYAMLAGQDPHIQRAAAALRWNGSWYEMQVAIDALHTEEPSTQLLSSVETQLAPYRRIGYDLRVLPARLVPLDIVLNVCVKPDYLRAHVKSALNNLFSARTLSNGERGLFHPDNLTFGQPVRVSVLLAAAQSVPGVAGVEVTTLKRLFEDQGSELNQGELCVLPLQVAQCDNDPNFPEHGKVTITVRGGR